jgi:hypothetical protein
MNIHAVTLRYNEALGGFPEELLRQVLARGPRQPVSHTPRPASVSRLAAIRQVMARAAGLPHDRRRRAGSRPAAIRQGLATWLAWGGRKRKG